MDEKVHTGLTYGVEDKPDLGTTIVLGFQNVITAFGGLVAVPLIIAGIAGFGVEDTAYMVSAALLASGIVSIIQSKGFGPKWFRVGAGLPTIMGTDFAFVAPAASVIGAGGITAYLGGTMLGALLEIILRYFVKPLLKFSPPVVTGSVISLMGMTLMSVAMGWTGGGFGSEDFGQVVAAEWFALPQFFKFGVPDFKLEYAILFVSSYLVTVIETVGVMQTLGAVTETKLTDERIAAGVRADGFGSFIAPFIGSGPAATFSENAGLIPLTRNASRKVAIMGGIIMIVMSLFPKFATLISIMPQPVLGGAGILMFGTVAAASVQSLSRAEFNNRNMIIVASALGVGLGVSFVPDTVAQLPGILSGLFSSGISAGTIVALVLNIILKEKD